MDRQTDCPHNARPSLLADYEQKGEDPAEMLLFLGVEVGPEFSRRFAQLDRRGRLLLLWEQMGLKPDDFDMAAFLAAKTEDEQMEVVMAAMNRGNPDFTT